MALGFSNTASGAFALSSNTTGVLATASGTCALASNTTGNFNTASGAEALRSNTTGSGNTATGAYALRLNTTGSRNTASGVDALSSNTTGSYNTAVGDEALRSNITGQRNIAIGRGAGQFSTGDDNIAIGHNGIPGEASTIRVGIAGSQARTFVAGIRGVTTGVANAILVLVDGMGQLGTISSSARFKEEVRDMDDLTERLFALRPVVFRYKPEVQSGERPLEYGLIAEEVAEVFPELVVYDEQGAPLTVKYHLLASMLLNELQESEQRNEARERELEELRETHERELSDVCRRLVVLEERTSPEARALPADTR